MQRFKETWEKIFRESRPILVYNSGRSVKDTLSFSRARRLPEPDFVIGGVGTEFHDLHRPGEVKEFIEQFGELGLYEPRHPVP